MILSIIRELPRVKFLQKKDFSKNEERMGYLFNIIYICGSTPHVHIDIFFADMYSVLFSFIHLTY